MKLLNIAVLGMALIAYAFGLYLFRTVAYSNGEFILTELHASKSPLAQGLEMALKAETRQVTNQ